MDFRTRSLGITLSPIKEMELRASRIPGVVSLAQGIPSLDTPDVIKEYVVNAITKGSVGRYSLSPGLPQLREVIEHHLAIDNIFYDYNKEIIVTAGSIEAITATLLTLLETGDEVIIVSPSYASYSQAIRVAHGVPVWVHLNEDDGWSLSLPAVSGALTKRTRAILLANPNNPTGTLFSPEQLRSIALIAQANDLLLIIDEVYKDLIYSEARYYSIAQDAQFRKTVVFVYSFSKAYAMTGWRVAFLATDQTIAAEILKVHDALVTCAPVVSQYAAIAALELAEQKKLRVREIFQRRRDLLCAQLDTLQEFFTYQKPTSSYFAFPRFRAQTPSQPWAIELLERARVAVVPGSAFGPAGENHIRLCFGRSEEDILLAMDRMAQFLHHTL